MAVTPPFPHCRTCSTQDDTSSELQRGAPPDGGEQPAASAFRGRQALARYLSVMLARGKPEPFVPGFDTGDLHGVRILSCCMASKGCRDQCLWMLLCVPMAAGGDGSITSGAPGGLGGSSPLQAASHCPSHPHIPYVPVGMAVGLRKELWDSCLHILGPTPSLQGGGKGIIWA